MQWITIATPPFPSVEQFDKVTEAVDHANPEGMEGRYVGTTDDGKLRVVTLWTTKAHADQFFANTLGPALARALGPEPVGRPEVYGIDVDRSYVRESVS
ncbi:MAG: hypothetical protein ACR2JG_12585 [Geodermatophilaceae bacterium]